MALHYNLNKIENWESLCLREDDRIAETTERLIHLSMVLGLGEITAGNVDEWHTRARMLRRVHGDVIPVTYDDLMRHVGLTTNARRMTAHQFHKSVLESLVDQAIIETRAAAESWQRHNGEE